MAKLLKKVVMKRYRTFKVIIMNLLGINWYNSQVALSIAL